MGHSQVRKMSPSGLSSDNQDSAEFWCGTALAWKDYQGITVLLSSMIDRIVPLAATQVQ